jgi:hypothetical protein
MPEEASMVYPVDPMSLQGDALRRWYLRSPDDIEQERQAAQDKKYEAFVAGIRPGAATQIAATPSFQASTAPENYGVLWEATEPNRWRGEKLSSDGPGTVSPMAQYRLASAAGQAASAVAGAAECVTCHGRVPPPLPFPLPFLPGGFPSFRDTPSAPPGGGSPKRRLPQCDVQYDNDSETCRRLPTPAARGKCWESASERRGYCTSHDGEVGWPSLQTR